MMSLLSRRITSTPSERMSLDAVLETVRNVFGDAVVDVYEAGGATKPVTSEWFAKARTTVVDLECDRFVGPDERIAYIQGDIRDFCPDDTAFDFIVCHYVLEHVHRPEAALRNFCALARPGGLIFIASPCFWSLNALVAKLTPFWFHVWFYRRVLGKTNAGTPGKAPFPTYHSMLIDPARLSRFFRSNGFDVIHSRKFLNHNYLILSKNHPVLASALEFAIAIMNALCWRRHDFGEGDFHLIVQRRAG